MTDDEIQDLWNVTPSGNVAGGQAELILNQQIPKFSEQVFKQRLEQIMDEEGGRILEAHQRVRSIVSGKKELEIVPHLPIDLISLNVLLPGGA